MAKLTKKQISERASRGWATRRAKAAQATNGKDIMAAKDVAATLNEAFSEKAAPRVKPLIAAGVMASIFDYDRLPRANDLIDTIPEADLLRLRKADPAEIREHLKVIADMAGSVGRRRGTKEASERFDYLVIDGFLSEVAATPKRDGQLWTAPDYVVRVVVREINRLRNKVSELSREAPVTDAEMQPTRA